MSDGRAAHMEVHDLILARGICSGRVSGGAGETAPDLRLVAGEIVIPVLEVVEDADGWAFRAPLPAELISDGAQSVLIVEAASGAQIGQFSLHVGEALAEDLRAEVAQLRAELDLLKAAFRREMRARV